MKKTMMIAAGLMLGSAGFAQTSGTTEASWTNDSMSGYPACSSTVTDSCIQLYERGVSARANLDMNRQMASNTAMGGPYEPATHGDSTAHGSSTMDHDSMAGMQSGAAVGGPVEQRTGYPPCDPGPGDDSCIQLYERGVTGN